MKKPPKFVRKAQMFCVTEIVWSEGKKKQMVHWFETRELAEEFYKN